MFYPVFIMGLILAVVFSIIFSLGFKRNNSGIRTGVFFIIIFLTVCSAGLLMTTGKATLWTINWSYLLFIALFVSLILAAKTGRRARTRQEALAQIEEDKKTSVFLNFFLWAAIIVFVAVIILKIV